MLEINWKDNEKDAIYALLKDYSYDINNENFKNIYNAVNDLEKSFSSIHLLTPYLSSLFLNSGINPLRYMNEVPAHYLAGSNVESIIIPNNITKINHNAFRDCFYLSKVKLSDRLETIEEGAFYDCYRLQTIEIPKTVKTIKRNAFPDLHYVDYRGTKQEWKNMLIANNFYGIFINCIDEIFVR